MKGRRNIYVRFMVWRLQTVKMYRSQGGCSRFDLDHSTRGPRWIFFSPKSASGKIDNRRSYSNRKTHRAHPAPLDGFKDFVLPGLGGNKKRTRERPVDLLDGRHDERPRVTWGVMLAKAIGDSKLFFDAAAPELEVRPLSAVDGDASLSLRGCLAARGWASADRGARFRPEHCSPCPRPGGRGGTRAAASERWPG